MIVFAILILVFQNTIMKEMVMLSDMVIVILSSIGIFCFFASDFMHFKKNQKAEFRYGCAVVGIAFVLWLDSIYAFGSGDGFAYIGATITGCIALGGLFFLFGLKQLMKNPRETGSSNFYVWVYECVRGKSDSTQSSRMKEM